MTFAGSLRRYWHEAALALVLALPWLALLIGQPQQEHHRQPERRTAAQNAKTTIPGRPGRSVGWRAASRGLNRRAQSLYCALYIFVRLSGRRRGDRPW